MVSAAIGAASASMNPIRASRMRRVDRHIRRPGLEHRQHRHDRLSRPRQQQRHTLPRAHPLTNQQVRQPVRRLIQLAIGPRPPPAAHRHRLRSARHLRGEHHRNRHRSRRRPRQHRPVTDLIQPGVLSLVEHIDRRQPPTPDRRSSPPTPAATARSAPRCRPRRTPRCRIRRADPVRGPARPPPSAGSGCIRGRLNSVMANSCSPANAAVSIG